VNKEGKIMINEIRILMIEDVHANAEVIESHLRKAGMVFSSKRVDSQEAFIRELKDFEPQLILADYNLLSFDGITALKIKNEHSPDIPFIFVSDMIGEELAVELIKQGTTDFVFKNNLIRLVPVIQRALRESLERAERKRAEEAFERLSYQTKLILESAGEGIIGLDADGKITFVNTLASRLLGYENNELSGKHYHDKIHHTKEDGSAYPQTECPICRAYRDGVAHDGIDLFWKKDGKSFPVEYRSTPIMERNAVTGAVVTFFDISELKAVMKEIEANYLELESLSRQNQLILESAGEGIFGVNLEGRVIFVNPAAAKILGFKKEELIGEIHHDKVHHTKQNGEPYPLEECPIYAAYRERTVRSGSEELFWRKDGTSIPIEYVSSPIIEKGKIRGAVITFSDLTERKRAEKALRESEERSRAQYKGVPIPTYTWQKVDNDFVLIDYNYAAEEITHGKIVDWIGSKVSEMYKDMPIIIDDMKRCVNEKTIIKTEMHYKFMSIDKEAFLSIQYSYSPPDLVLVHIEDITERKQAEERIKESLKEKEVLLREIHHRVKNNLQIISSLLKLQSGYFKEEKVHQVFQDSQNRIKTMALIHEKLYQSKDFSKIDFAEYIKALVHEIYRVYGIDEGRIALSLSIENILFGVDTAIPCGLIINELISNSLKYAFPEGRHGEIRIEFRTKDGNEIEMVVGDNGVGMPEEKDFRSTDTLGLHLVTILVEDQLGGKIILDRTNGMVFTISFRVTEQ
jgi:PAS domain S-box-containing protein